MSLRVLCILCGCILSFSPAFTQAQNDLKDLPDPDPELERAQLIVAEGFEINLYAADPMIAKPIQMNWDERGRLWLVSSGTYPQIIPGEKADDKILVLDDVDWDGRADTVTTFAEGLMIPTGVAPGDGGAYVANSTELLHLADTDGDGKADRQRVMLSGFGTEDTHHIIHTLRWAPDGDLYFNQSIYIHSHVETPYGPRRLGGGGIWRYDPRAGKLDVFVRGFVNPWGHAVDHWGQHFATDGAYLEGVNYLIPGAYYFSAPDAKRFLQGLNPGSPKHCSLEILMGDGLPEDWEGSFATNDFRGHRVCRFVLTDDGAGYSSREQEEIVKSSHVGFRPIDIKMGPDGAIYIADWYNPIIQHGEVDFRDPRRDHTHGRIWRVAPKGFKPQPKMDLRDATNQVLLDLVAGMNTWQRDQARRILKERGAERVMPDLQAWIDKQRPVDFLYDHNLLEALWLCQALHAPNAKLLALLARSEMPQVRAAVARVAGDWTGQLPDKDSYDLNAPFASDENGRVRLAAARALAVRQDLRAAQLASVALDKQMDRFLDYALWLTMRELQPAWLPEVQAGKFDFGDARRLAYALQATGSSDAVQPLAKMLAEGKVPAAKEQEILQLIASLGGPKETGQILAMALDPARDPARRAALLEALGDAAEKRSIKPDGQLGVAVKLINDPDERLAAAAARACGWWRVEEARPALLALAGDAAKPAPLRAASMDALARLGGDSSREALDAIASGNGGYETRAMAASALIAFDSRAAAKRAAEAMSQAPEGADPAPLLQAFLRRQSGPAALAAALKGAKLPGELAKSALRVVSASGRPEPDLSGAIASAGGLNADPEPLSPEAMQALVDEVKSKGDAARGEALYRSERLQCLKCHAIAGAGGQVGPDLSSVGASAQIDYLIDSLLLPSKAIKEGYNSVNVSTKDGEVFTGIKLRQTEGELVLRSGEDREVAIPLKAVRSQDNGLSLMPTGLADLLTRGEICDLVRFLSELGKQGPYGPSKARVARTWRTLLNSPKVPQRFIEAGFITTTTDDPALTWANAYSTVGGELPLAELQATKTTGDSEPYSFARFKLDVSTGGPVLLKLNSAEGISGWVDQTPLQPAAEMTVDLKPGAHWVTLVVNRAKRTAPIRCELGDAPGSPAKAAIVGGK